MMAVDADSHPDLSGLEEGKDLDAPLVIAEPEFSVRNTTAGLVASTSLNVSVAL
jgi:hypothetical protein